MRHSKKETTNSTVDMCVYQSILTLVIAILPTGMLKNIMKAFNR